MMKEVMSLKLDNGLSWIRIFVNFMNLFIRVTIKMVKRLAFGSLNWISLMCKILKSINILVVADHMMKEEIALRLENGLNCLLNFVVFRKLLLKVNIKMEKSLVDGIPHYQELKCKNILVSSFLVVVDHMMKKVNKLRLENGLS